MNNVMCVKWGTLYDSQFVNNLYAMCKRNLTIPFKFHCITNEPKGIHKDVNILPNEDPQLKGWWQKIIYFKKPLYDIDGPVLTLDLDCIIVKNLDCFFNYKPMEFCMKHDKVGHGFSSCIMRFQANQYSHIYNELNIKTLDHAIDNSDRLNFKKRKFWGDQIYITKKMENDPSKRKIKTWPVEWVPLFGKKIFKDPTTKRILQIPPNTKIINWAGYKNDQRKTKNKISQYWHCNDLTNEYRK